MMLFSTNKSGVTYKQADSLACDLGLRPNYTRGVLRGLETKGYLHPTPCITPSGQKVSGYRVDLSPLVVADGAGGPPDEQPDSPCDTDAATPPVQSMVDAPSSLPTAPDDEIPDAFRPGERRLIVEAASVAHLIIKERFSGIPPLRDVHVPLCRRSPRTA
jgi:hypothetical protein